VRLLENYTFTLVLENSNTYDYVTEKLFQALLAGSIPGSLLVTALALALCCPLTNLLLTIV
jgi:hypothetical protein